jgi:hypothetical protein
MRPLFKNIRVLACLCIVFVLVAALPLSEAAQSVRPNSKGSDASKIVLPDPLIFQNGKRVHNAEAWPQRRQEILHQFENQVYGRTPAKRLPLRFTVSSVDPTALGGQAIRKQVTVHFTSKAGGPKMDILLYVPAHSPKPVPVFLALNFAGNHTVDPDPGIKLGEVWTRDPATEISGLSNELVKHVKRQAPESSRGMAANQWQVEKILARGYALATIYYGDIEPDFDGGIKYGARPLFFRTGQTEPAPDEWEALGAWAWGLSRAVDYLKIDSDVDPKKIAVMGFSRLGKAALWAAAQDQRLAVVISNESGKGGASLYRSKAGESVEHLNTAFPHWFCANFHKYTGHDSEVPVDGNLLLALIAPRPLYVASAEQDPFSDPPSEFLAGVDAGRVYELLGKLGLGTDQMPPVEHPIMKTVGYHIRAGKHDVTAYDWDQYLNFADMFLKAPQGRAGKEAGSDH